jgi:hypothetical protein
VAAQGFARLRDNGKRQWAVHKRSGITFVYIPANANFLMGNSGPKEPPPGGQLSAKPAHRVQIPHAYLLGMTEVTWEQYNKIACDRDGRPSEERTFAAQAVTAPEAAEYCNLLNARDNQDCYKVVRGMLADTVSRIDPEAS